MPIYQAFPERVSGSVHVKCDPVSTTKLGAMVMSIVWAGSTKNAVADPKFPVPNASESVKVTALAGVVRAVPASTTAANINLFIFVSLILKKSSVNNG